jgi:hydrophobic/amphiphilic exporter-1 (mainly G- bacteria), HAE1 family
MDLIKLAIKRPTAIMAAVFMIIAFGVVAMETIPIQLTPDVRRPVLQVTTWWPGAAPTEVEKEITNQLEEELTGLEGLEILSSSSQVGRSRITLEYQVGQNMERAFMLLSNRLGSVSDLPFEAKEPRIRTSGSDDRPIARFAITRMEGNTRGIETYGDFVEDVVTERLERVPGVSQISASGGSQKELQIIVEPTQMARYGLTVPKVIAAIRGANASITAGAVDEGKRRYIVRTDADTDTIERVREIVLHTSIDQPRGRVATVKVGDIAKVEFGYKEPSSRRRFNGKPMIRLNAIRDQGANVIETMDGIYEAVKDLNENALPSEQLVLKQFYDETTYIRSAINLVHQNIYIGGVLAALILLIFLRSIRATLIVSLAIPVSVVGAFVAMAMLGRSINVISLAGIAFAVGMVVDAAIVVQENIYRHRQDGNSAPDAAYNGAKQVWGAVLASALTTVVVFVPLLTLNLQAGQLFRDIAVAISVAVSLSLLVSITVIPALSQRLLRNSATGSDKKLSLPGIDHIGRGFVRAALAIIRFNITYRTASICVVLVVCSLTAISTFLFLPKLDYLPDGNRNFVIGRLSPPPGYNLKSTYAMAERIENEVKPLWVSVSGPEAVPGQPPKISDFFFIAARNFMLIGAKSTDQIRAQELEPVLNKPIFQEPGTRGFVYQASIFGRRIGGSRTINLDISGPDLDAVLDTARRADDLVGRAMPRREGTRVRPRPGLQLAGPEIRLLPDQTKIARAGLTARDFGQTVDVLNEGAKVLEINLGSKRLDLTLKGPDRTDKTTQGIGNLPVVTGNGTIVPVSSLSDIDVTSGPVEIRHLDRARTITLQIKPSRKLPLETAIDTIKKDVVGALVKEGLPPGTKIGMSGAADQLSTTWEGMKFNLMIALVIVYLVMAVLFESFVYPLIIMLSVPLATAGGVGGLALVSAFQPQQLDMMTMLGFVILIGIVVNNAILLVDQTLQHVRLDKMAAHDAIMRASKNRMRPIFMSTLTSVFGLLPLVIFAGAGSELYKGLGSVVLGGLTLSAVLTLLIIPPLLALLLGRKEAAESEGQPVDAAPTPAE